MNWVGGDIFLSSLINLVYHHHHHIIIISSHLINMMCQVPGPEGNIDYHWSLVLLLDLKLEMKKINSYINVIHHWRNTMEHFCRTICYSVSVRLCAQWIAQFLWLPMPWPFCLSPSIRGVVLRAAFMEVTINVISKDISVLYVVLQTSHLLWCVHCKNLCCC